MKITQLADQTQDGEMTPEVKRLRVMIYNFCLIENGTLLPDIDLRRYAIDSGQVITNTVVQELCSIHNKIQTLNLTNCSQVADVGLWAIAKHCNQIKVLNCYGCDKITTVGIRSLSLRCSDLVELDLSHCVYLDDISLTVLAGGTWKLRKLSLQHCPKISDNGIARIAQGMGNYLQVLNLNGCPNVGEFGDRGLKELGNACKALVELYISDAKRVEDGGLLSLASGCIHLEKLLLNGCETITKKSLKVCVQSWSKMKELTILSSRKLSDQDFQCLTNSPMEQSLTSLTLKNFHNLTDKGIAIICQGIGPRVINLNFEECKLLTDYTSMIIANYCPQLRTLDLSYCGKFTDESIHTLSRRLKYLTALKLDGNTAITTKGLLSHVGREFEFVEMATQWLGYQARPQVETLIAKREEHKLHTFQAIKIQCLIRKRFAERIFWVRYREKLITRVVPLFQAVVRGYIQRKRYFYIKHQMFLIRKAIKIQSVFRRFVAFRSRVKILQQRNYEKHCEKVALLIQRIYRGYKARIRVAEVRAKQANERLLDAQTRAKREMKAIIIQRVYHGYKARCLAIRLYEDKQHQLAYEAMIAEKKRIIQRIARGKIGRIRTQQRRREIAEYQMRWHMAREIQRVFRGHQGRLRFKHFQELERIRRRNVAALKIQHNYRGYRGRLLAAVAFALRLLRAKHQLCALEIQRFLRGCMGRQRFQLHKEYVTRRKRQVIAVVHIQRLFRGHKGREARDIEFHLQKMESSATPLILHLHHTEDEANKLRKVIKKLESMEKMLYDNLFQIERELEHCVKTTNKYTDSSRINQTPQRFLTKFLKVRLKDHLEHEAVSIIF